MTKKSVAKQIKEVRTEEKKDLFGLSLDELKMVNGGGGVIIQHPRG